MSRPKQTAIQHKTVLLLFALLVAGVHLSSAQQLITTQPAANFPLTASNIHIVADTADDWLVLKTANLFQDDMQSVTGLRPEITTRPGPATKNPIIIGTLQSAFIRQLASDKKIDVSRLENQWEAFQISTITNPFTNNAKALVIAGSDKRGAAYGLLEISRQMGVSPWYWWADVPRGKHKDIFVKSGNWFYPSPGVKYRGIFINDEHPAFANWAKEKFGGVNHRVYERVFELLLRLKANFLWPAMWDNAFNDDDSLNPILADRWGIVMSTSHHEPMMRAQKEWTRYGKGAWNYVTNKEQLNAFWKKGIENMGSHESVVTMGMRGDGDEPMTQGTAIHLLEEIVADQRKIIEAVSGKPAAETPQVWALYKEVQDYYDKGMRVPDDVTLLFSDDNWGNLRRVPAAGAPERKGGYGIYYHFDYVGGPRNYKWINTNNIARVWEQMHLAWEYKARQIWIVNVGDLKPMELPISFFLDYAYRPQKWNQHNIQNYFTNWAADNFGDSQTKQIAYLLEKYSQYGSRIKPELLNADTYLYLPGDPDNQWDRVCNEWRELNTRAQKVNSELPAEYRDAFYQLVLHPVRALGNLHYMYAALARNRYLAAAQNTKANLYADSVKYFYTQDSLITIEYHSINHGKWNHMMDQTHIGYTYWQQPPVNKMPEVQYIQAGSARPLNIKENKTVSALSMISPKISHTAFYQKDNIVSIHASHYSKVRNGSNIHFDIIPGIGKNSDGVTTFPVSLPPQKQSLSLQYEFYTYTTDSIFVHTYLSATLNFLHKDGGLQFEISIDNEPFQTVSSNKEDSTRLWDQRVASNNIIRTTGHFLKNPGKHLLTVRPRDPGIIFQKFILSTDKNSVPNPGPEETLFSKTQPD